MDEKNVAFKKREKIRSKKLSSRVDLTAMVGVSFLLIAFFMLTTAMSRPQSMIIDFPESDYGCDGGCRRYDENRVITILLGDNDEIVYYMGLLNYPIVAPKNIKYGKEGIRKELLMRKKVVLEYSTAIGRPKSGIIVIIKPSKKSNYRNLVDILDEMAITNIDTYTIVNDFTPDEAKLLETK
jgi:biopolymer transport protein ExbD